MNQLSQNGSRSVDVTGLPDDAVRAVETHVAALRMQSKPARQFRSHEEWSRAFHEWVNSHPKRDTIADWSRESIYAGLGQ
jgi:hypothetical protein